ncbi:response regulator [Bdellovibrionota bacterium FG-2]
MPHEAGARNIQVLAVEDNAVNQMVIARILEKLGCYVEVAADGIQALKRAQLEGRFCEFDLVFMDCQLPLMDGYEATRQLRALGRGWERVPIVALTAHVIAGEREKCLAAGMTDYLPKPFQKDDLQRIIHKYTKENATQDILESVLLRIKSFTEVMGEDSAQEILKVFISETPAKLEILETLLVGKDFLGAARIAHTLKGSFGNIGAKAISLACDKLEHFQSGDVQEALSLLGEIQVGFGIIREKAQNGSDSSR